MKAKLIRRPLTTALLLIIAVLVGVDTYYIMKPAAKPVPYPKLGSIVRLVSPDGSTFCSGTVISDTIITTAAHCVVQESMIGARINPEPIEIRASDNMPRGTFGLAYYATTQMDQALIVGKFKAFSPRPYISSPELLNAVPRKGLKIISCGYPLHGNLFCSDTTYEGVNGFSWATTGTLLPGMSGGPAMLEDGTLVAINVAVDTHQSIISPIYNLYPTNQPPKASK